jgi:acyl-coenzyme A synthetase/AMP-(fatty) acid ligase
MLYDRWRHIAREYPDETALRDFNGGGHWTFRRLAAEAENGPGDSEPVVCPQGISPQFILDVLRAWRSGGVVCPLESGQARPRLDSVPAGIVHLKTTSGSTGAARFVAFTAGQLMADAENIVATMGLRRDWPNLGVVSLAHSYGFSSLVTPLLLHGIPLLLSDSPLPEAVRRTAAAADQITLPAVPALWRAWHDAGAIPPNLRLAISAGAPLPLPLEQAVYGGSGLKLHNFYGASECGGIAYDASALPRSDAACVGAPMRGIEVSLNQDGCLEIRGPSVGQTYWPDPQPQLAGGIYRTSDLAELEGGLVFLRGRAGDVINVAGRKVAPESIERMLLTHPQVRDCLVFGVPSPEAERSEIIVACVAAQSGVAADTLRDYLLARLPAWQVPREWQWVASLEVNRRGKTSRSEWRRRYLERSP